MDSQYKFGVFLSKVDKKPELHDKNPIHFYDCFSNSGLNGLAEFNSFRKFLKIFVI